MTEKNGVEREQAKLEETGKLEDAGIDLEPESALRCGTCGGIDMEPCYRIHQVEHEGVLKTFPVTIWRCIDCGQMLMGASR